MAQGCLEVYAHSPERYVLGASLLEVVGAAVYRRSVCFLHVSRLGASSSHVSIDHPFTAPLHLRLRVPYLP